MPRKLDIPGLVPVKKIVPLRAPRMSQSYDHLPPATKELVEMMDSLRSALLENANDGVIEQGIADVRAALSIVRRVRNLNANKISERSTSTYNKLGEKYLTKGVIKARTSNREPTLSVESPTSFNAWIEAERRLMRQR